MSAEVVNPTMAHGAVSELSPRRLFMLADEKRVEEELRTLLGTGASLGDALRVLQNERHRGLMVLWRVTMTVQGTSKEEAMRLVVHETSRWRR